MQVFTTKAAVRDSVRDWRAAGQSVALVPTMGYLHRGHMALVERAKAQADRVVTSIFVNPLQFGPGEDLATYPRDADRDLAMLRDAGVDGVFLPSVEEVYPPGAQTIVETTDLARMLIGKLRPGHFRGVTTVVTKLFNIVQPDVAVFGEKDYQQLCIIRQMVRDLDMPLRIEGVPTVREADGLALSSRNVRLTPEDRAAAVILSQSLFAAEEMAKTGITASRLRAWVAANIQANPRADLQSADIRDAATLASISGPLQRPAVILLAVRFGKVLLIDQRVVTP
ncbi:pantoate--beta-alanine ligase [Pararhodobacter aggregans]|uniref:Pantothenate synthetase n=1 Tax=Pararhodobacter aggregans TaxID=404875 RepID=A0A2T7UN09_9RHOB|nr:pantoate--beta-alanine ligase [Pararhodobacter aggregans]PTX02487.1 pantothenate synthetase [Pararhodobacter aggregans]PVE46093.1 pantoate--beta-alanine ligase [Pararhodobacter aggregans]